MSEIIRYLSFSDWLISLSIMLFRSVHAVTKDKILWCIYTMEYYLTVIKKRKRNKVPFPTAGMNFECWDFYESSQLLEGQFHIPESVHLIECSKPSWISVRQSLCYSLDHKEVLEGERLSELQPECESLHYIKQTGEINGIPLLQRRRCQVSTIEIIS